LNPNLDKTLMSSVMNDDQTVLRHMSSWITVALSYIFYLVTIIEMLEQSINFVQKVDSTVKM